jgi:hypothetical protein
MLRAMPGSAAPLPLVGRAAEAAWLAAAVARAADGRGGAAFLSGEPRIGKTRLAREALALARARGFVVLEGAAYPLESDLAYGLIVGALGPFLRGLDPVRRAALVSGLADLGRLFAELRLPAPEPLLDPALEKTRLFEAVARLLDRLAREAPLVLFLDDLHWADPARSSCCTTSAAPSPGRRSSSSAPTGRATPTRRAVCARCSRRWAGLASPTSSSCRGSERRPSPSSPAASSAASRRVSCSPCSRRAPAAHRSSSKRSSAPASRRERSFARAAPGR